MIAKASEADGPRPALESLIDGFREMLEDAEEGQRRRLGVQIWAEQKR